MYGTLTASMNKQLCLVELDAMWSSMLLRSCELVIKNNLWGRPCQMDLASLIMILPQASQSICPSMAAAVGGLPIAKYVCGNKCFK